MSSEPTGRPEFLETSAPAKLNLFLEVLGRRTDGYHDLETVMVAVDWSDELEFRRTDAPGVQLTCDDPSLPTDDRNLVVRAIRKLAARIPDLGGLRCRLHKRVPHGAGMGGGSSDAAATLVAVNRLAGGRLTRDELAVLASELGSDIAFFLHAPAAVCRGRGELVERFDPVRAWHFVVVAGREPLSTPAVFRALAGREIGGRVGGSADVVRSLRQGDAEGLAAAMFNRLEAPAFDLAPAVARTRSDLLEAGALAARMTGSGSAVFGLCRDAAHAVAVAERIAPHAVGRVRTVQTLVSST